jgi:hypothetical protein
MKLKIPPSQAKAAKEALRGIAGGVYAIIYNITGGDPCVHWKFY